MGEVLGELTRGLVAGGGARALRVDVREIAMHGADLHGLAGPARDWFVDGLACAALLSAYLDDGERLTMQVQASSPRFAFTADVDFSGAIRARLTPASVPPAKHIEGVMLVLKSVVGREVYRGATSVDHGSFAEMLHEHLMRSSQTAARVAVSGGVGKFVERLPDSEADLDAALDELTGSSGERQPLRWECGCSDDRVLAMIESLGSAEIRSMIEEDDGAVVTCHFCTREVVLTANQLGALL